MPASEDPPAHTPRPLWLPEHLFPFESRFLDAAGSSVHYVDEGEGPTLLMLHGNPTYSFLYRHLIRELRSEFRCIALDYPGFGRSTAPNGYGYTPEQHADVVEAFVAEMDLHDAILVAHDWGGPIGLSVATGHPGWFRGLVLANTWAWPLAGTPRFERFARIAGGPAGRLLIRHANALVNVVLPAGTRRKLTDAEMDAYRGPFPTKTSRAPTAILARAIVESTPFLEEVEAGLEQIDHLPLLLTWGQQDVAFQDEQRKRFEATFPRHRTVLFEDANHYVPEDAPEAMARAIQAWYEKK